MVKRAWAQLREVIKKSREWAEKNPLAFFISLISLIIFLWILWETYRADNLGFSKQPLWEWMDLLLVPLALALAGYVISRIQKKTEFEVSDEKRRQETFEKYIDRMSALILTHNLKDEDTKDKKPEVKNLARTLTLNVLRELGAERNRQVCQFLQESELIGQSNNQMVFLSEADLRKANLRGADLSDVNLRKANLNGADLCKANLIDADLFQADLREADLSDAYLHSADLREADLSDADLSGTWLSGADLRKAPLRGAVLSGGFLFRADLREAKLSMADLRWAWLEKADLREASLYDVDLRESHLNGADLSGANLHGAKLSGADLSGCKHDDDTVWPDDFDPSTIPSSDNDALSEDEELQE